MEIKRFFIGAEKISNGTALIDNDEFFHITKVLRLKKGYEIILCAGGGVDFHAVIESISNDGVTARIIGQSENLTELPFSLTMLQALPSGGGKLEVIIQKAVETGVGRFIPFASERAGEKKVNLPRLEKIAKEAAKQCGATRLMEIRPPVSFREAVEIAALSSFGVMAYEEERANTLFDFKDAFILDGFSAAFIIGAEGGFTAEENECAKKRGIASITLGARVLRCETAGVVVSALISGLYGDVRKNRA
ncbi:MAG: 16S rRNA (uracil(1498)-N(3))-methyltransferase [Clostridiales bacterium]|jgi:16S rRNA (uracil1498-N3)-methyltransferase|nr:16S rRNA (uracil(1498)-N(3))-methyltransferase [Clostridiales bacterium]